MARYAANMEVLVKQLETTGAKLIFATTTPYPAGVKPCRKPEYAAQHIDVNDLHGLILPRRAELQKPANVHFNPEGSELMANQVAEYIVEQL